MRSGGNRLKRLRWSATVLALVLVAAACGRSDNTSSSSEKSTTTSAASGTGSADFGDLKDVCQGGSGGGATAQGVTADAIRVGTIADPGYTGRPGVNQELFDTADVFSQWCNARGGINGRKIQVDKLDAALFNYKAQILKACDQDFYLVGGGGVFDNTGVADRLKCLLPDVAGFVITPEARSADLLDAAGSELASPSCPSATTSGSPRPSPIRPSTSASSPATSRPRSRTAAQAEEAVKSLGWKVVYNDQYPATGPHELGTVRPVDEGQGRQGPDLGR